MNYKFILLRIILIIFFFSIYEKNVEASRQVFIVMKVNNNIITNIHIEEEYRYLVALNNELLSLKKADGLAVAKNSILREKIKEEELLKFFKLDQINEEYLSNAISELYKSLGIKTEIEFENYLSKYDLSYENVRKKITIEMLWNQLIYEMYQEQVVVDVEGLKENINANEIQKNYLLSEIFFTLENEEKINEKYSTIKNSISEIGFKNTATKFSLSDSAKLGGKIGWINENQVSKILLKEIQKLEAGDITKPIPMSGGYLILTVVEKKDKKISLNVDEELKKLIVDEKNRQLNNFSLIYFNKTKFNTKINEN